MYIYKSNKSHRSIELRAMARQPSKINNFREEAKRKTFKN